MAVWSAIVGRLLEQEAGSAGSSRIGGYFHHDGRDHPLHARWLGRIRRRISCNGRKRRFQRHTDIIEPLSLAEAYLDVTVNKTGLPTATKVAFAIRQQIRDELSLTASAGVAANKSLAKVASDWRKPDGLFVIQPKDVDTFLPPLSVARMPGVGTVTEARLKQIQTVGDLRAFERASL
jgi:nucleotidyltransferase/DNA polymerase involved in DNA repair